MKHKSFTLIEILVALSIVSIGLTVLIKAQSQQAQNLSHLEQKTIANLVTSNLALENRLRKNHTLGFSNGSYLLGNRTWYWQSNVNPTPDVDILKLSLSVFTDKKSMDDKQSISQLELYLPK